MCSSNDHHRELSEALDPEISKGVALEDCLQNFGTYWVGDITGGLGTTAKAQDLAKHVNDIDDFLSHDWATSGYLKFITLCIVYNSLPATIAAVLVSGTFGTLEIFFESLRRMASMKLQVAGVVYQVDSVGYFGLVGGMTAYLFVLMFWQRLRTCWRPSKIVFMDKLCIHQTNPELKAKGILGLAGFLSISDRIVVLWSPRYFTRLWCVYEIASWMALRKPLRKIEIEPVAQGAFIACVMCGMSVLMCLLVWLARLADVVYMIGMGMGAIVIITVPVHIIRRLVRDLRKMPQQVSTFSFENAECFCCAVKHIIPGTDIRIPCDREVISDKLNAWFKTQGDMTPIDLFNDYVRKQFGKHITKRVGGSRVKYFLAMQACIPGWLFIADRFHILERIDGFHAWRLFFHYLATTLGVFPSIIRIALEIAIVLDRLFGVRKNCIADLFVTLLGVAATCMVSLGLMFGLHQTLAMSEFWPQAIMLSSTACVTLVLYREDPLEMTRIAHNWVRAQGRKIREVPMSSTRSMDSMDSQAEVNHQLSSAGPRIRIERRSIILHQKPAMDNDEEERPNNVRV
eukprot:gb/GFBE01039248.1/.p1 GENE.gb/GFBE01039248.1/~~gb/GFBE01039248.1/.p1  ORF type:complete len:571 (+),score=101.29 gb/GFBE01039248.1/:1-1713(+)